MVKEESTFPQIQNFSSHFTDSFPLRLLFCYCFLKITKNWNPPIQVKYQSVCVCVCVCVCVYYI